MGVSALRNKISHALCGKRKGKEEGNPDRTKSFARCDLRIEENKKKKERGGDCGRSASGSC